MARIVTTHVYPPIPVRSYDWCARDENYEPGDPDGETGQYTYGGPVGWGSTEAEAIADYLSLLEEV